jgi:Ca-activated chloride channel family protein
MRSLSVVFALLALWQTTLFRSGVDLVRIPISVRTVDQSAASLGSLTSTEFAIFEDGVMQQVALLERESVPLRVCVLLDVSHSMVEPRASRLAMGSYGHIISELSPSDEVSVVGFAMSNFVAMSWRDARKAAMHELKLRSEGGTAIIDAIKTAMRQIENSTPGRSVIVIITDGGENASAASLQHVIATRRQSETEIYAFKVAGNPADNPLLKPRFGSRPGLPPKPIPTPNPMVDVLPQLVGESGGQIFEIASDDDVVAAAKRFVNDLRTQYTLAYSPRKPFDGTYRRIQVEITAPGYSVRHRRGYLAVMPR